MTSKHATARDMVQADEFMAERSEASHSPTPWCPEHYSTNTEKLVDADGEFVMFLPHSRMEWTNDDPTASANAAHIVRCVNAHDELVAALQLLLNAQRSDTLHMDSHWAPARAALAKVQS